MRQGIYRQVYHSKIWNFEINSTVLPSSEGYISQYRVYGLIVNENNEGIISIISLKNYMLPVLGLNSGYKVKYSPPPLGVPSGFSLWNSLRRRAIFDRISLVSSYYGYSILPRANTGYSVFWEIPLSKRPILK